MAVLLSGAAYFYDPVLITNSDSIALVAGSISGIILSPDQDVDGGYIGLRFLRSIPIFGPVISGVWRLIWWPYTRMIPHRSWISHFPIISTIIRVIILSIFLSPFLFVFRESVLENFRVLFVWFVGLCMSDFLHFYADWLSGELNGYSGKDE